MDLEVEDSKEKRKPTIVIPVVDIQRYNEQNAEKKDDNKDKTILRIPIVEVEKYNSKQKERKDKKEILRIPFEAIKKYNNSKDDKGVIAQGMTDEEIEASKKLLEETARIHDIAAMEAIAQEKQAQLAELEARIGETTAALDDVNTRLSYQEQLEIENNALAEQLNDEIWQLQQELYAQQSASSGGGGGGFSGGGGNGQLSWPTWTNWITSSYGWRTHPIYGDQRFHAGIDIGAGFGDTIMASASGTVITCYEPYPGCNYGGTGYGNYLVIDHGNGLSTLYAHCRDIYVSNGSYVSAGQAIGEVGSTGGSTGAHLHYEVRVNGSTVDPLSYLP